MLKTIASRFLRAATLLCGAVALSATPAPAQIQSVDPNATIDGDLDGGELPPAPAWNDNYTPPAQPPVDSRYDNPVVDLPPAQSTVAAPPAVPPVDDTTYAEDDLIGAAEGLFGRGAEGLARVIEDILQKQGRPNAYIVGREGGGAFVLGVRYGSGTLFHRIEGNQPVYWTGPSVGLDAGANAGNTFVLVYNLLDTEDLFDRFPAGEGQAYFVGGFNVSYLRSGDVVMIPVRLGAGVRLGANIGYMKFSKTGKWMPF